MVCGGAAVFHRPHNTTNQHRDKRENAVHVAVTGARYVCKIGRGSCLEER